MAVSLVLALTYLLAPAVEGANLSDFHAVSLTASLLPFAFHLLHAATGPASYSISIILAMSTKEDVSPLVLMMGLYILFWLKERNVGGVSDAEG